MKKGTDVLFFRGHFAHIKVLVDNIKNIGRLYVFVSNHFLFNSGCRTVLYNFKTEVQTSNEGIVCGGYWRNSFSNIKASVILVFEVK